MKKYKRTYKTRSYSTRREGCFVSEFLLLVQSEISFPSLRHDHPRIVNHPSQELSTSKATIFALRPLFFFKHLRCPLCVKRHFMVFLPSNIWDELYFNLLEKWSFSANHSLSHPDLESYRGSRHAADASMSISCMSPYLMSISCMSLWMSILRRVSWKPTFGALRCFVSDRDRGISTPRDFVVMRSFRKRGVHHWTSSAGLPRLGDLHLE